MGASRMSLTSGIALAGFLLSLVNALQTWRKNRPIISLMPDDPRGEGSIRINPVVGRTNLMKFGIRIAILVAQCEQQLKAKLIKLSPPLQSKDFTFFELKKGNFCCSFSGNRTLPWYSLNFP
jgi:hypothetical protein